MSISVGPTGNLVTGNLFDVSRRGLEERLRDYDSQLYIQWNPMKRKRMGCWEIRRRPEKKTAVYHGEFGGTRIFTLEYREQSMIAHVLDVDVLTYAVIDKLKSIDTWSDKRWTHNLELREAAHVQSKRDKAQTELKDRAREYKHEIRDFMEMVNSGLNPAHIARHWK